MQSPWQVRPPLTASKAASSTIAAMRRVIANILAAACLVLFVLVGFMWVRGYAVADHLRHQDAEGFRGALSSSGDLAFYSYKWPASGPAADIGWTLQTGQTFDIPAIESDRAAHHRAFIGFHFFRDTTAPKLYRLHGWCLVLPYWFLTLLFGLVPLGRFLRMTARAPRRAKPGLTIERGPEA